MRFHNYRHLQYAYQYYVCPQTDKRYGECAGGRIRQEIVTAGVSEFLQKLYAEMQGRINLGEEVAKPVDPTSALQAQRADLEAQRERLEIMAQTGRITLDAFDKRAAIVDDALASLSERISREAVVAASRELVHSRFLALGSVLSGLSEMLSEADPVAANQWLSEMIESVTVLDGKVSSVKMLL